MYNTPSRRDGRTGQWSLNGLSTVEKCLGGKGTDHVCAVVPACVAAARGHGGRGFKMGGTNRHESADLAQCH